MLRRRARFAELEGNVGTIEGSDGWLFLSGDSNDVLGQHTGRVRMGRDWERKWRRLMRRRRRQMRRLGVPWLHFVVPDREAVYADKLPAPIVPAPRRPIHRLLEIAADTGVELLYPHREMLAAREEGYDVYNQSDTHWNARGAFLGYELIVAALGARGVAITPVDRGDVEWRVDESVGDLGGKLDPPRAGPRVRGFVRRPRARLVGDNGIMVTGRRFEFESDVAGAPRCVVFGTSYAVFCLPYLAESFSRLSFVHTTAMAEELVRATRADVMLVITSERGLRRVPADRGAAEMLETVIARKRAQQMVDPPFEFESVAMPPRAA